MASALPASIIGLQRDTRPPIETGTGSTTINDVLALFALVTRTTQTKVACLCVLAGSSVHARIGLAGITFLHLAYLSTPKRGTETMEAVSFE